MELKTARLTLLVDPNKKAAFEHLCALQDRTASQVVRQLIRDYLIEHGVEFVGSGSTDSAGTGGANAPARTGANPAPGAPARGRRRPGPPKKT